VRRALILLLLATALVPIGSSARADDPLVYVALGDSYTSGPLVLPHDTTHVPQDCGQSIRNYPHLVALLLGADVFRDVSCGSAEIEHLAEPQDGLPLGGTNAPQHDALDADVDLVTIGIGGNDVGFVGLALDCVRLLGPPSEQPCAAGKDPAAHDEMSQRIAEVRTELVAALAEVQRRAPEAEVLVVSYPTSLPHDAVACWPYLPILPADMPYLVAKFKEMNAMLAAAAAEAGATYVDIYTPSIGHDACKLPGFAWVNGMVLVPPSFPAHPNELSYLSSAPVVAAAARATLGLPG
jgi:lysophospholipase L1-like esterase